MPFVYPPAYFCEAKKNQKKNKTKRKTSHRLCRTKHLSACVWRRKKKIHPVLFSSVDEVAISMLMTWSKPLKIKSVGGLSLRLEITKPFFFFFYRNHTLKCAAFIPRVPISFTYTRLYAFIICLLFASSFSGHHWGPGVSVALFRLSISRTLSYSHFKAHGTATLHIDLHDGARV